MGYTLKIGEAMDKHYPAENGDEAWTDYGVEHARHDNAPAFDDPTDYENKLWPSYSAWDESMQIAGLHGMFYNVGTGLLKNHPGRQVLTASHKVQIDAAFERLKDVPAEYGTPVGAAKVRLTWLKYWVDWALENCKEPSFYNS